MTRAVKTICFTLILLGVVARIVKFGSLPLSLNRDETALGYNAFALSQEGIDEWGIKWPIVFKSFGDYKLPGYIYSLVPLINIFGVSEIIIRLPSLIAGLTNIILIFLIVRYTFPKQKSVALVSAAVLASMPWAIHYTHIAFEAHVALTFLLTFLYFALTGLERPRRLAIAPAFLAAAITTYNTPLLLAPFMVASFVFLNTMVTKQRQSRMGIFILGSIAALTLGIWLLLPVSKAKAGITIFTDPTLNAVFREKRFQIEKMSPVLARITYNRYTFFSFEIVKNYISSFSPQFLILRGGAHPWHTIPGWGHLLKMDYILLVVGLVVWIVRRKTANQWWLLALFIFSPLPAAITVDAPHATRSLLFLTLSALPISLALLEVEKLKKIGRPLSLLVVTTLLIELLNFTKAYQVDFPEKHALSWKVGLKEAIYEAETLRNDSTIAITDYYDFPYIYVLLYTRTLPSQFLPTATYYPRDTVGLTPIKSFLHYRFIANEEEMKEGIVISQDTSGKITVEVLQ